jgi:hypothetical protein
MKHLMIAGLVLAACSGGSTRLDTTTPPAELPPAIELGEMTLFERDAAMLKFHADGSTELGYRSGRLAIGPGGSASTDTLPVTYRPGPTIRTDGTVVFDGEPRVRINADGTVTKISTGEVLPIEVTDTTVSRPGDPRRLELQPTGDLVIDARHVGRIEGADTAGKRRVVLAFLGMMLMASSEPVVSPPPASEGPLDRRR